MANELDIKKSTGITDPGSISVELEKLASLLERATNIMEETRDKALENHNYFKTMMEVVHEDDKTISEDGVLEKATNESLKLLIEASKTMEPVINALTKVLSVKIQSDAFKNSGINKPIDIDSFK